MNSPRQHAPLTERRYIVPLVLITSLFFLWALGVNLNDILIRHLKKAFELTDFQSSLIQSAFFGGYFLAALPAGWVMQKIGYKRGILVGLLTCATGAFLFIPAATARVYGFFLFALFVMACGQCFLEVAANPYVTILGPSESAARRLNLAQSFNSVGAFITPIIGATFILSGIEHTQGELSAMTPAQLSAYQASETAMVKVPYLVIASIFLFVALLILFSSLPETHEGDREDTGSDQKWAGILRHSNLVKGVVAQFFYVGAQVGVASFVLRFVQHVSPGTREKAAAFYLTMHLLGFMVGRFAGSAVMKHIAPAPASNLRWRCNGLHIACGGRARYAGDMGGRADWLFQLNHVPDDFRAQPEEPRTIHEAGLVTVGDVHHRRRDHARRDGASLGPKQYPACICGAALLLRLRVLFRRTRIPAFTCRTRRTRAWPQTGGGE